MHQKRAITSSETRSSGFKTLLFTCAVAIRPPLSPLRLRHQGAVKMKLSARPRRWLLVLGAVLIVYLIVAYIALPALWKHHEHEPGLANLPMVTRTSAGIPGDALNVGLVGSKEDIIRAMHEAEWFPADPITLRTSPTTMRLSVRSTMTEKRNSLPSKSRMAEAQISDITSACGWCLKKERMAVRSGSAL